MHRIYLMLLVLVGVFTGHNHVFALQVQDDDGIVKILAIGNSFSQDAIENSLHELAAEKGIKTVIGNMYIGGAPLTLHVTNAEENKPAYSFRKTAVDGSKSTRANTSIESALAEEDWDYISFQQASPLSGQLPTIQASLPALYQYVKARAKNPKVKFIYHQTWAYSQHAIHPGFANYNNDQLKMYESIVNVSKKVSNIVPIDLVVPAGTAIQNARTSYIGDNFDRDGYHLRLPLGRYVAACTWFESIFGINVVGLKYKPAEITDLERAVAQNAAHFAVQNPYQVTELSKFKKGPKAVKDIKAPILVDFGSTSHETVWNPIFTPLAGKTYALKDSLNQPTQVTLEVVERFTGKQSDGKLAGDAPYRIPKSVYGAAYFGQTKSSGNTSANPEVKLRLSGLNKKKAYQLFFFSPELAEKMGKLDTEVICQGKATAIGTLVSSSSGGYRLQLTEVTPAADGTITLTLKAGANNTNTDGIYFLSAMRVAPK